MINQAPIVRYTASVSEKFFPRRKTFSAESSSIIAAWITGLENHACHVAVVRSMHNGFREFSTRQNQNPSVFPEQFDHAL